MNNTTSTGKLFATRLDHCLNMAMITPNLYRSADPGPIELARFKTLGIKSVINLRSWGKEQDEVRAAGLIPLCIPLIADIRGSEPPTEDQIRYFFYIINDPKLQPVAFHCMHGKDRTGTMAAIYRMEVNGWTPEEAFEEMQYFGFHDNWLDLIKFIKRYEPRGYKQ